MTQNTGWLVRSMSKAEFIKLSRRRGLVSTAAFLSVGVVLIYFGILEVMHLIGPASTHGPAGGTVDLGRAVTLMTLIGGTGAILIGTSAGAGDANGIFGDLVATGRSRFALFFARIPGAIGVYLPMMLVAFAVATAASILLAGGLPTPTASLLLQDGAVVLGSSIFLLILSVGIASLTLSVGGTIAVLMAWQFIVQQLLMQITWFGNAREALPLSAVGRLLSESRGLLQSVPGESALVAVMVLIAWSVAALGIGAYRTKTMDA